jgi:hypothetical protein
LIFNILISSPHDLIFLRRAYPPFVGQKAILVEKTLCRRRDFTSLYQQTEQIQTAKNQRKPAPEKPDPDPKNQMTLSPKNRNSIQT